MLIVRDFAAAGRQWVPEVCTAQKWNEQKDHAFGHLWHLFGVNNFESRVYFSQSITQVHKVQECIATDRSYAKLVIVMMERGLTAGNKTPQVGYGV